SQLEKDDVTARDQFLQRAVEQFERTLEIDSEDLDAHFGLYRCYTQLAESAGTAAGTAAEGAELMPLAREPAYQKHAAEQRLQGAARLLAGLGKLAERPQQRDRPKLGLLQSLASACRATFRHTSDPALQAAAAAVLAPIHRQLHGLFVPDSNARGRAVEL